MKKHILRHWWTNTNGTTTLITERFSDEKEMVFSLFEILHDPSVVCIESETDGIITVHKAWTEN